MKVIGYTKTVPPANNNFAKLELIKRFVAGAVALGDDGVLSDQLIWQPSDVAVIQGFVHAGIPAPAHLRLRKQVVEKQMSISKHALIADSNLFLYKNTTSPLTYLRYSFNGVFPQTGNYFSDTVDPARWKQIRTDIGIDVKEWRTKGNYILLACQRDGGWSMKGNNVLEWVNNTYAEIRRHTDRPVLVRAHPGDRHALNYLKKAGLKLSNTPDIIQDFKNAWATITYNSSPGVASAIEGIPVYVTDPDPRTSQAYDICNTDLATIENPNMPERQQWLEKLSMSHWKFDELSNGSAWRHMRNYV
jgi:hypothetical protein